MLLLKSLDPWVVHIDFDHIPLVRTSNIVLLKNLETVTMKCGPYLIGKFIPWKKRMSFCRHHFKLLEIMGPRDQGLKELLTLYSNH